MIPSSPFSESTGNKILAALDKTDYPHLFRSSGAIAYRRGNIQVIDRAGLEAVACECYRIVKREYDDLYADLSR